LHRIRHICAISFNSKLTELLIQDFHFTRCTNNKCKAIYPLRLEEAQKDSEQFCPKCKVAMQDSHLVQCKNCQTVLNFIPKFPNEEDIIFYVDKCSSCSGTLKDEKHLTPNYFPESFI
jgi:hypothetical protein